MSSRSHRRSRKWQAFMVAMLYIVIGTVLIIATAAIAGEVMPTSSPFDGFTGPPGGIAYTALLGATMYWLFGKHLPAKDKQITDLISAKDSIIAQVVETQRLTIEATVEQFTVAIERQRVAFREAQEMQAAQTTREVQSIMAGNGDANRALSDASRALSEAVKAVVMLHKVPA